MIKINVLVDNKKWIKFIKNPSSHIKKKVEKLNKANKFFKKKKIEFTLLLTGEKKLKYLNKKFRKKNKSTDVLSFPAESKSNILNLLKTKNLIYLGDIIINLKKLKFKNQKEHIKDELDKLWIHGFLHLLGYRHKIDKDYLSMKKQESKFLKMIN